MSNRGNRIVFGGVLLAVVLMILWIDHRLNWMWGFAMITLALSVTALSEYYAFARCAGGEPMRGLGFVMAAALVVGQTLNPESVRWLLCAFVLAVFLVHALARGAEGALRNTADTLFGVLYVPFLATFLLDIRSIPGKGEALTLLVILATKCGDMGAYFGGKAFGRHKLAPVLSPGKTIEGAGCGLAAAVGVALIVGRLPSIGASGFAVLLLGLVVGIASQLGDLAESLLKRDVQADDAGSILPGLGGALDVIDSLLVASPAAWFWIHVTNGGMSIGGF